MAFLLTIITFVPALFNINTSSILLYVAFPSATLSLVSSLNEYVYIVVTLAGIFNKFTPDIPVRDHPSITLSVDGKFSVVIDFVIHPLSKISTPSGTVKFLEDPTYFINLFPSYEYKFPSTSFKFLLVLLNSIVVNLFIPLKTAPPKFELTVSGNIIFVALEPDNPSPTMLTTPFGTFISVKVNNAIYIVFPSFDNNIPFSNLKLLFPSATFTSVNLLNLVNALPVIYVKLAGNVIVVNLSQLLNAA